MRLFWTALLFAVALLTLTAEASAARRVKWDKVEVRAGGDAKRVSGRLRKLLKSHTRKAKWGKGKGLELHAKVVELSWQERDDVLLVSVTVVARIEGGKSARSHIRLGGRPKERSKLERQALKIVAGGLVTRLSAIARTGRK